MPRIIEGTDEPRRRQYPELVDRLATELQRSGCGGQPLVYERRFPATDAVRTTVYWDAWETIPEEERVDVIHDAYERVEGPEFRDRLALVIGLTFPEAADAGMLPFAVQPSLRRDDPVTEEQVREAMLAEGASILNDPRRPELRFGSEQEAEDCRRRLVERLPGSEAVWVVARDVAYV